MPFWDRWRAPGSLPRTSGSASEEEQHHGRGKQSTPLRSNTYDRSLTHFTHARRHPYSRSYFCCPARCYSSLLRDCTCRKNCTLCAVSAWLGRDPSTRCRGQPLPQGGREERQGWRHWHHRYLPAMKVTTHPTSLHIAATVVTYHRHVRHAHTKRKLAPN